MNKALRQYIRLIDKLSTSFGKLSMLLCLALAFLTVEQVIARYWFRGASIGLQELQWHLYGAIFCLSMAWTLRKNEHVRVDVIYQKLSHRTQRLIDNIGHIFFLLPLCWILFQHGWTNAEITMSYPSQRAMDHYSMLWLGHEHSLYPILSSLEHFLRTWILIGEGSSMAGGLEARWIPKAFIPLGALLLALQGTSLIIENVLPAEQADEGKALTHRQPKEDL